MKRFFSVMILICAGLDLAAGLVTVTGTAEGSQGKIIRLVTYADQVSYKKITLAAATVAPDGSFTLSAELESTSYALVDLSFRQAEIFLVPGTDYVITIYSAETPDEDAYYNRPSLNVSILKQDAGRLNEAIGNINQLFNEFLLSNSHLAQSSGRAASVQEVTGQMAALVSPSSDQYLKDYLRYKSASLELFMRTRGREKLAGDYLTGKPVLYGNIEYMDFFHLYFEKYFLTNNRYMPYSTTSSLVNGTASLEEILAVVMKDPVLADPCLAEVALMAGLKEMSGMAGFKQQRVLDLLDDLSLRSIYQENKNIAVNIRETILWMKPGSPAPAFDLPELRGGRRDLSDYRGKYLYLSFIDMESPSSLSEMNLLADIYLKFKDRIHFVSVIADELNPGWSRIVRDYRMNWDLLIAGLEIELLEQYGATALPVFILIDPQGRVYKYPAPSPSEDLEGLLGSF